MDDTVLKSATESTESEQQVAAADKPSAKAPAGDFDSAEFALRKKKFGYRCYLFFKRVFDVVLSASVLLLFGWFICLLLIIKWLEDFANPVYVSERVGKDGKTFKFFKIRTMCKNAEEMKLELIKKGLNEADPPAFKMKNDPRITKFGKFLRKTGLDELLQFINVLNGTMSFIGPRSPLPEEVIFYDSYQKQRLLVKGGLLCFWQISPKRNDMKFSEWVELDLKYIKQQSISTDLSIIFKGVFFVLFTHDGE